MCRVNQTSLATTYPLSSILQFDVPLLPLEIEKLDFDATTLLSLSRSIPSSRFIPVYRIGNEFSPTSESRLLSGRASLEPRHIDGGKSPYVYTRDRIVHVTFISRGIYTLRVCVCVRARVVEAIRHIDSILFFDTTKIYFLPARRKRGKVFFDRLNYTVAYGGSSFALLVCTRT